jgi:hypothetical protein
LVPIQDRRGSIHTSCRRFNYYTYLPLGCGSKTHLSSVGLYIKAQGSARSDLAVGLQALYHHLPLGLVLP